MAERDPQVSSVSALGAESAANGWRPGDWLPLAAAVLALVAAATVVILRKSIWLDEAITMEQVSSGFARMLELVRDRSSKPPGYFVGAWAWHRAWPSLEGVRAYSTLCVVLSVLILDQVGRALEVGRGVRSLGILAACTGHVIWMATEARPYAVSLLFCSAAVWMFVRVWIAGSRSPRRDTVLFVLACYGALLTFYYTGFVLAGLYASGLLLAGRRRLIACGVVLALLMAPWALMVGGHAAYRGSYLAPVTFGGDGLLMVVPNAVAWVAHQLAVAVHGPVPVWASPKREVAYLALLAALLGARLWQARGRLSVTEQWATAFFVVTFVLMLSMRYANRWTVDVRHWTLVAMPAVVYAGVLASRCTPARSADVVRLVVLVSALIGSASLARNEQGPTDWRSAMRWIMSEERPGQPIVTYFPTLPIAYHYRGPNEIARIPVDVSLDGGRRVLGVTDVGEMRAALSRSTPPDLVAWMVQRDNVPFGPADLEPYLRQPLTVLERRDYHGVRAWRLRLREPVVP